MHRRAGGCREASEWWLTCSVSFFPSGNSTVSCMCLSGIDTLALLAAPLMRLTSRRPLIAQTGG